MADIRIERFIWQTTKGLRVDNSKRTGAPLFGGTGRAQSKPSAVGGKARPSPELAVITGKAPLPRSEVISKVWDHIRKNNLQNPQNKREIVADEKLRKVFGKDRVTMFEMNKRLSNHLEPQSSNVAPGSKTSAAKGRSGRRKSA